jgi:hypothetical protein
VLQPPIIGRGGLLEAYRLGGDGIHGRGPPAARKYGAVAGQLLKRVGVFTSGMIAVPGIPLGRLHGEGRSLGGEHTVRRMVFSGNEVDGILQALGLAFDQGIYFGISAEEWGHAAILRISLTGLPPPVDAREA